MIALLRTILFDIAFVLTSVPAVLLALAAAVIGSRPVRAVAVGWARIGIVLARVLLGIRLRVEGRRYPDHPVIYAIKHESMYETLAAMPVIGGAPSVVLKRELTRIPLWGRVALLYGVIPVDREGSAAALRLMLTAGKRALAEGRSIVIFPEGTRVAPGEAPPLRPGFAGLYRALGLPVIPVAVDSGRLWPREGFSKHAGTITLSFGEPIPAGLSRAEIEARVHAAINRMN